MKSTKGFERFFKDTQLAVIQVKKVGKDEHVSNHPKKELDSVKRWPVV